MYNEIFLLKSSTSLQKSAKFYDEPYSRARIERHTNENIFTTNVKSLQAQYFCAKSSKTLDIDWSHSESTYYVYL